MLVLGANALRNHEFMKYAFIRFNILLTPYAQGSNLTGVVRWGTKQTNYVTKSSTQKVLHRYVAKYAMLQSESGYEEFTFFQIDVFEKKGNLVNVASPPKEGSLPVFSMDEVMSFFFLSKMVIFH